MGDFVALADIVSGPHRPQVREVAERNNDCLAVEIEPRDLDATRLYYPTPSLSKLLLNMNFEFIPGAA